MKYFIYRNGVKIAETTDTEYEVTGLTANTEYQFSVAGVDDSGNISDQSATKLVRTTNPSDIIAPTVPGNLTATTASATQIDLAWDAATDAVGVVGYRIKRNGVEIATTANLTYADIGLSSGTLYFYTVAAYDATPNYSAESNTASDVTDSATDVTAPTIPTNLTVTTTGETTLRADWNASMDAVGVTGYKVYKGGVFVSNVTGGLLTYTLTGLTASTEYAVTVTAYDAAGNESAPTAVINGTTSDGVDTTAPTVPANLLASAFSASRIDLTWDVSTDAVGVTGYNVYRNDVLIATSATNSYSDTGLFASTLYRYKVSAYDAAGNTSALSTESSDTTDAAADTIAPTIPTNLIATVASSSQINLSWTASTDAVGVLGYRIRRGTAKIGYLGASISQYTVLGAETLGFTRMWDDNLGYGGGGPYKWAQNLTNSNVYWAAFNTAYQANPTTIIWWQLCAIASDSANETNANALLVANEIKARVPGVVIYVSAQPDYVAAPCSIAGSTGPARMDSLVSYLVGLADPQILAGPVFADLAAVDVQADGCHQDTSGQATTGQELINFFKNIGLTEIGTSAVTTYQNTGLTANTSYSYSVSAYDAAGNESLPSAVVSAKTQTGVGSTSRALGIYAVKGPSDSTIYVNKPYVSGVVLRLPWSSLNPSSGSYSFTAITDAIAQVTALNQKISLVVFAINPPSWVTSGAGATFTNGQTGTTQPVPWDSFALAAWDTFCAAMAAFTYEGFTLATHPRIANVDCSLIGLQSVRFVTAPPGYVLATYQAAVLANIHSMVDRFPTKNPYYGLFGTGFGAQANDAKTIRDAILVEFNGISNPKVAIFQETWTGEVPTAATGQLIYDARNQTPIVLQACGEFASQGSWSQCNFATNDTVGSASTYAINNFNTTYLEIYNKDLNLASNATICQTIADQLQAKYDELT